MLWLPLIIPAFKVLKQKDQKTAANLGYISRLSCSWLYPYNIINRLLKMVHSKSREMAQLLK